MELTREQIEHHRDVLERIAEAHGIETIVVKEMIGNLCSLALSASEARRLLLDLMAEYANLEKMVSAGRANPMNSDAYAAAHEFLSQGQKS